MPAFDVVYLEAKIGWAEGLRTRQIRIIERLGLIGADVANAEQFIDRIDEWLAHLNALRMRGLRQLYKE